MGWKDATVITGVIRSAATAGAKTPLIYKNATGYHVMIDWGDGTTTEASDGAVTHVYPEADTEYPIRVEMGETDIVTRMFEESNLVSIASTDIKSIGFEAFYGCTALTSISMPNVETLVDSVFMYCTALTSISLPNVEDIGILSFMGCTALTSISMPNVESIGRRAFSDCSSLTTISLPSVTSVGWQAFEYCSSLTSISLPNVESIGAQAFYRCTDPLLEINIGSQIQTIGYEAFIDVVGTINIQRVENTIEGAPWGATNATINWLGEDDVLGLEVDFNNNVFTRLLGADGLDAGSDFDAFGMYGGRRVCAVADDGTIAAYYGDSGYVEDGSIGQIMVRQPKFWYKVVAVETEPITTTDETQTGVYGVSGVHMRYYIADRELPGFKLHPAFINADGDEVDAYYIGAYEGSLYDASEEEYRKYDTWDVTEEGGVYTVNALNTYLASSANDVMCSIAGVKPASGEYSTQFTRPNCNTMAKNRGSGWGQVNIKIASAEQMLMLIEYGMFNMQTALGAGVTELADGSRNESVMTGATASLGNGSGNAAVTYRLQSDGTYDALTGAGQVSVRYRGVENFYGNIWKYVSGMNIWGNGTMLGGQVYVASDFEYAESKHDDNYEPVGFTIPYMRGSYPKAFGYTEDFDWIFMPSKTGGNSSLPIGDALYTTSKVNGYRIAYLGGRWNYSLQAGAWYWSLDNTVGARNRGIGCRLVYMPGDYPALLTMHRMTDEEKALEKQVLADELAAEKSVMSDARM